jgi:prepilin-type N-terminal cleavage/methylation domain-containing protein
MKKGFTLIEVLIVIGIIGALSMLSINGYMDYRRSAILDLSVDNIISQILQSQSRARFGEVSSQKFDEIVSRLENPDFDEGDLVKEDSRCFGFYFINEEGEFRIKGFSLSFLNLKNYDILTKDFVYSGCDDFSNRVDFDFVYENDISFDSDEKPLSDMILYFSPPSGEVFSSIDSGLNFGKEDFSFLIKYGEDFRRIVYESERQNFKIER